MKHGDARQWCCDTFVLVLFAVLAALVWTLRKMMPRGAAPATFDPLNATMASNIFYYDETETMLKVCEKD